jgi:hypothetical protein
MTPKNFRITMIYLGVLAIIILLCIFIYIILKPHRSICEKDSISNAINAAQATGITLNAAQHAAHDRDIRVLEDPLYPPLNRTDEPNFNAITTEVKRGDIYVPTNGIASDSYRLIGYLSNHESVKDAGGNNWKFFGRMKDRYTGEYYISPVNNNIDLKIPLTNDIVVGDRLRDLYTLPREMRFKSPMLNTGVYEYTEIPKTDFTNARYM